MVELNARLETKWLWVRITLLLLKLQISPLFRTRSSLTFRQQESLIYSKTLTWYDKNIQSNAPYKSVLTTQLNRGYSLAKWWAFAYELSGCGFKSRCIYLNFRYRTCFEQGVPDIQATIECRFIVNAYVAWQKYAVETINIRDNLIWTCPLGHVFW